MTSPIPASAVSQNLQKHLDPKAPLPLRLMAAKGMVPMGPKDMVTVLCALSYDEDQKIQSAAEKSLLEMPERILGGALKEALFPKVLDHLAHVFEQHETHLEAILINKETPDETFAYLGEKVADKLLGIIVENQVRLLRHTDIIKSVLANPNALKSQVDRIMDFAVRTGINFTGMEEFENAKQRLKGAPPDPEEDKRIHAVIVESLPEEMLHDEPDDLESDKKVTLMQRLSIMTIAQKVVLAQKGNKTIRGQLLKDRNKLVATAAIKNPGVNEGEVVNIAGNRSVCDDVIRIISTNREWTRNYQVKLALMNNPKTPIGTAMRFLNSIRVSDLKLLASNKNIPSTLATAAKKLLQKRSGR